MKCPCMGCVAPKRHPGCHSGCEEYVGWRKERDEKGEAIRKEKIARREANEARGKRIPKARWR